jgi:hypothetical protein
VLVAARSLWLARASPVRDWLAIGQAVRAEPQRGGQVEHEGAVAEVLLTGVIGTCPLLYLEALAFITRERRDAAACRATGRTCFLGERSSIDLPEHDVERAEDRRDVGKHVPAA